MALNFSTSSSYNPLFGTFLTKNKDLIKLSPVLLSTSSGLYSRPPAAQSEGSETRIATEDGNQDPASADAAFPSARAQLGLLEQLTSSSPGSSAVSGYESDSALSGLGTIREQLARLVSDRNDDFTIPLGKNLKKVSPKFLTTSQKRNIRRQSYLNEVSQRNDSTFFATIGAFVLLPPVVILGIAILTGYVQLFP